MYKLEDRILFDGAAIADVVDAQQEAEAQQEAAQAAEAEEAAHQDTADHNADDSSDGDGSSTEAHDNDTLAEVLSEIHTANLGSDGQRVDVLLVSSSLENADDIVNSASTDTIIVVYDARTASAADLLQQITTALDGKIADSIGFATESGENAHIQLFADTYTSLDTVNDSVHQNFFSNLDSLLDEGGQVNLFASNLASTAEGEALVDAMSDAIGHDVAASTDETGSEAAGGDWNLEYSTNDSIVDVAETYLDENLVDNFDSLLEDHVNHEVAFINSSVMNVDEILNDLGDNVEIVMLKEGTDGLQQITDYLNENSDVKYDAVHILTHGNEGYFVLNGEVVNGDYVNDNAADFVQWRNALSDDADVMIYGCNLAGNQDGQSLVANIASLTGADVAASTDSVGDHDWSLDYNVGDINYGAFDIHGYNYHLADQLVTSLADDGAGLLLTLREAIFAVGEGESITFNSSLSGTITLTGGELSITQAMSISGLVSGGTNTITINANNARAFNITTTDDVLIQNLNIVNGNATVGGAISNASSLTLNHVNFSNNSASVNTTGDVTARGGAIYTTGDLTIINSTFSNNSASAISSDGGTADALGGAIYNNGALVNISSTTFTDNVASASTTGTATDAGGAIYNAAGGYLSLTEQSVIQGDGFTFNANTGGAIYNASGAALALNRTSVQNNVAVNGGGIYNDGFLSVTNESDISGNTANYGGGVYNSENGSLNIDKALLLSNSANFDGGGIYNNGGKVQAENLWIHGNGAVNGAGIYNAVYTSPDPVTYTGEIILQNTTIDNNFATDGGAIYNQGKIYGENVTLASNFADEGSAIYIDSQVPATPGEFITSTTLFNATIALNAATTAGGYAIYRFNSTNDNFYINSSLMAGNSDGIGNYLNINGITYLGLGNWTGTNFISINNYITGDAGTVGTSAFDGIFADGTPVDHGGWVGTLALNTANWAVINNIIDSGSNDGPTIYDARGYMRNSTRDIGAYETNAYVARNADRNIYYTSVQDAITNAASGEEIELFQTRYYLTAELTIGQDLIFSGEGKDTTVLDAQTLYVSGSGSNRLLTVNDGDLSNTIFVRIDGMTFRNGGSVTQGGAIYNSENLLLNNTSIYGSVATSEGGAIYNYGGYLYIERSEIYNNSVVTSSGDAKGGAISNFLGKVRITESSIYGNSVNGNDNGYGGAIYTEDDGTGTAALTIISSAIYDNTATGNTFGIGGGVLGIGSNQVEITNSTFAHNTADSSGGAIYFTGGGTYKLTNITVAYNETGLSTEYAVVFDGGNLYSINSLFLNNYNSGTQSYRDLGFTVGTDRSIFNSRYNQNSTGYFADLRITDHGGWSKTIALAEGSSAINGGTNSGVPNHDQRGYETNGTRDIGAYEYNGIVAYYWDANVSSPAWVGTSTISAAGIARSDGKIHVSEHVIRLVNTRILEANITINTWRSTGVSSAPYASRTVSIYGHQEGGTVIDAGRQGQIFDIIGENYTSGTTTTYVMGTTNINRLTMTNGFTTGNGGAITTTQASDGGVINVNHSSMTYNIALGEGGAVHSHGADPSWGNKKDATYNINSSLVAYNIAAGSGGAISIVNKVNVTSSTVAYNRSFGSGGAIMVNANGGGSISNSTVSRNFANTNGGGIYLANGYGVGNTILAKNRTAGVISSVSGSSYDPDYESGYDYYWEAGTLSNGGHNLVEYQNGHWIKSTATNFFGPKSDKSPYGISNGDILGAKEFLFSSEALSDNGGWTYTMALAQNSAAVDKGSGGADQRGYSANRNRDIGAYELNGIVATIGTQGYSTIEEAVASASAGDTITLVGSRILGHDLVIGKNITIKTASSSSYYSLALIDAKSYGRIFAIESSNASLNLSNLILANGTILIGSGQGGQQAAGNGGAIFSAGTLTLSEVSIANSFAQLSGGAIYSAKSLTINTSGINQTGSSVTPKRGAYFARNSAQSNGGAIYASNNLKITGSTSVSNYKYTTTNMFHLDYNSANAGGAIYASNIVNPTSGNVLYGVQLYGNNATTRGGGLYLLASSDISFEASEFIRNSAMRYGGAVYTETTNALTFKDVDIENHFAFNHGAGIYYNGLGNSNANLIIHSSAAYTILSQNHSLEGSGGAVYIENANQFRTYSEHLRESIAYSFNDAAISGGAIFATNVASGGGYAIAIGDLWEGDSNSSQVDFSYNQAGQNGGAIYLEESGSFYASENVNINDNSAGQSPYNWTWNGEGKGGGIFVINSGDFIYRNNGLVYGNTARNFGGAFYIENSGVIDISYTEIGDNAAGEEYWTSFGWIVVADGTVSNAGQGGAFYLKGNGNISFTDLDFYDNHSISEGGAVYIENGTNEDRTLTINTSSFDRNMIDEQGGTNLRYGGAVYVDNAIAFNIANTTFAFNDNTAVYLGYGSMSLNFTTFAYNINSAGTAGSTDALGIYLEGAVGKNSAFVVNNSILHDGASSVGYRFGDNVTIPENESTNNIYTYFNNFKGANKDNLTRGTLQEITAYLPCGDTTTAIAVRDADANLVGNNATASTFITNNLYLSTDMDYTGGRRSRALALQSVNSIANHYLYNSSETFAGNVTKTVSYDRSGSLVSGLMLVDNFVEVTGWSSHSGGTAEYEVSASEEPLSLYAAGLLLSKVSSDSIDSLIAGQWTWDAENSKIVVRLANDANPASISMSTQTDKNSTIIYDQRGNMRSGVTVDNSAEVVVDTTSWTQYGDVEDQEYQISSAHQVTGVTINYEHGSHTLTEGTSIEDLGYGEWIWDAENSIVIIKNYSMYMEIAQDVQLTTEQVTYTYYTYGEIDVDDDGDSDTPSWNDDGDAENLDTPINSWIKVVVAEDGTTTRTAATASDVHVGLGAFKANLYMTVTTNADNDHNPRYRYNYAEFSFMDNALANGVTLREAVYWIDSYDMTAINSNQNYFDADRYVKFADSMFDGTHNIITLTAGSNSSIIMDSDVVIGMINEYEGYSYTDSDSTVHYFKADNSFLAQSNANRIIINGGGTNRIFDNSYHTDNSQQSGHWNVASTLGLNNVTLTNGYIKERMTYTDYNGYGGAIYNGSYWDSIQSTYFTNTMHLNNTVVENSTATNAGTTGSGSDSGLGGGIYNRGIMTIQDSTITGNEANGTSGSAPQNAGLGGGIYNNGTLTIERSLISENHVLSVINKDSLAGNGSATGGGIFSNGTLYLYSSTVSGNYINAGTSEVVDGSAITIDGGRAYIYGNTISYNKAYDGSGNATGPKRPGYAVYLKNSWDYSSASLASVAIRNNIFAQNYINGDTAQNRRDIIVTDDVANHGFDDFDNIVGSYYQGSGFYDFAANISTSGDIHHFNSSGIITDLNMSDELLYNGGITKSYRIETASVAIGEGDYTDLSVPYVFPGYSTSITYDQRNATAGTDFTTRTTIGAYELITQISISSDVADAALPSDGIAYDFSNDRGGWLVNLRNALYLADQGATVTVTVVNGAETFELVGGELLIFNGITLTAVSDGISVGTLTVDAKDNSRIFAITDPVSARVVDVTLENLKLVNGNVASDDRSGLGGAIYTTEGLTLSNVEISDVTAASHGGAIYSLAGGLTLTDVTIDNATSTNGDGGAINQQTDAFSATHLTISNSTAGGSGGAIYITDGSTFTLTSNANGISTINDNTSGSYGGGIYFRGGTMNITDAYIYNNAAASDKDGGGLFVNSSGTITITTSTFGNRTISDLVNNNGNTAARGAGIFVYSGNLAMVNSTISGNTATKDGGGLYFDGTSLSLTYVTIANNYAGEGYLGGGVYMNNGSLTMINSVIAQNYETTTDSASDFYLGGSASVSSVTYSAIGQSNHDFSSGAGNIVGNASGIIENLGLDTSLYDNGGNTPTLYVMANSDLTGAGTAIATTASQNGRTRANPPTIGAYEGGTTTYYYVGDGGDVNVESSWNTAADGSGTALGTGGFEDADNLYIFDAVGANAELSTGTWTISDRSFVTVATAATFTISGDAFINAFVHRTPTTQANMTITVENSGTLVFNNSTEQMVNLSSLGTTSDVNYTYNGNQIVYTGDYGNLTISGSGTKTTAGTITVNGDLTNDSTLTSSYDITVNGDTSGTGSITATNISLNGTSNSISGDLTAATGVVTFAGGTSSGTITAVTVNAEGTVADVNATTLNSSSSLTVNGTANVTTVDASTLTVSGGNINTTDLTATTLNMDSGAAVTTVNADLTTINSTSGSNTLTTTASDVSNVNYDTWAVNVTGNSTLAIDRGSNAIQISDGTVVPSFNVNNMDVDSGSTLKFVTTGNATLTDIDSTSLAGTFDGTLWVKCQDISLPGSDFSGGNMSLVIENSGYFDLVAGTTLTFGQSIDINNVRIIANSSVPSATLATLASSSGAVSIGNVISVSPTYSIKLDAATSATIGAVSGITDVTLEAGTTATVNGVIDISGNLSSTATTTTAANNITVGGNVSISGDLNLGADITASNGSVSVGGDIELTGSSSSISAIDLDLNNISGASDLALTATGSDPIILGNIDLSDGILPASGNLTLVNGDFNSGSVDVGQLNVDSQASLDTGSNNITAENGITNDGILTTTGTITVTSGDIINTSNETLNAGDINVNGDLINSGTLTATGTVTISGDLTNTSTNTFEADKAEVGGNVYDIGTMNIDTFTLTNHVPAGTHTASVRFSAGTVINEFIVEADKHITLVGGDITVNTFTFEADATPTSTFTLAAGTSVTVVGDINYNTTGYDANYFVTTGTQQLIRTMDGTNYLEYRIKNISSATVTVVALKADAGEKISVHIEDSVKLNGQVISGIQDTVCFTTYLDHINGTSAIDIGLRINWDSSIEGSNFTSGPDKSLETLESGWSELCTVTVDSAAGRSSIDCDITHNGTYTIAMAGADMSVPPNPTNVNIYEMANSHFLSFNDNLDTNIFLPFEIGVYPYFKPDTYATAESLDQLGKAIYRQMEYRLVTDPQTNPLYGQVSPIGAETGQTITEQASLTLTADAPVYVVADGEYSAGEGWLPITEPASVENIEEYQEPITQGQINEFYLEFGGREDIFTRPASFKSDLDEMLDDLLAG